MPSFDDISGCVSADYVVPSVAKPLVDYTDNEMPALETGEVMQSPPLREMMQSPPPLEEAEAEAEAEVEAEAEAEVEAEVEADDEGTEEEEAEAEEAEEADESADFEPIVEEHDIEKNPFEIYQKFNTFIFIWVLSTGVIAGYLVGRLLV